MPWWKIVYYAVTYGPEIYSAIKGIIDAVSGDNDECKSK